MSRYTRHTTPFGVRYAIDCAGYVAVLEQEPRPIAYERELLTVGRVVQISPGRWGAFFGSGDPDRPVFAAFDTRREACLALIYETSYARGY